MRIALMFDKFVHVDEFLVEFWEVARFWVQERETRVAIYIEGGQLRAMTQMREDLSSYLKTSVSDLSSSK